MADRFRSYISRQRDIEPRVHTELNRRSRERLTNITVIGEKFSKGAISELIDEIGYSELDSAVPELTHEKIILNGDTELVLAYIEQYIRVAQVYQRNNNRTWSLKKEIKPNDWENPRRTDY